MKIKILDIPIRSWESNQWFSQVETWLDQSDFHQLATVNPEFLVEADRNSEFKKLLKKTYNLCDGIGIVYWTRWLTGIKLRHISGVMIAQSLCQIAAKKKKTVYFLGGFGVATRAAQTMKQQFPDLKIAGSEDGHPTRISSKLKTANPDILLVAFGAPAQEFWIKRFADQLPKLKIAGGFGGTFDFWAGRVPRAPDCLQTLGLEWLFRLMTDPRKRISRVWRAVVVFSFLMIKYSFKK